jgi:hypothetical protein
MAKRKIHIIFTFCILFSVLWFCLSTSQLLNFLCSVAEAIPAINKDHTTHDPDKCHNLQFNLIMPTSGFVDRMPVLRGIVPIKIEMSPEFQGYGRDSGYRVLISVDYKGVFEENDVKFKEADILDMTYQLDTRDLINGTHLINVNVIDYYNHFGNVLLKVIVDN